MSDYQPGDIYKFTYPEEGACHPYAILGRHDSDNYLGCMITHASSESRVDNVPMQEGDFVKVDENGADYEVHYSVKRGIGSHFMRVGLIKPTELDVYRAGQLTAEGLSKLNEIVKRTKPELWDEFVIYADAQKQLNKKIARQKEIDLRRGTMPKKTYPRNGE
jgi:ribosomal protein S13